MGQPRSKKGHNVRRVGGFLLAISNQSTEVEAPRLITGALVDENFSEGSDAQGEDDREGATTEKQAYYGTTSPMVNIRLLQDGAAHEPMLRVQGYGRVCMGWG